MDIEDSFDSEQILLGKGGLDAGSNPELFYYFNNEKIYLSEKKDLVLLQFQDKQSRSTFLSEMSLVTSFGVWDPYNTGEMENDNYYNALVLHAVNGEFSSNQINEFRDRKDVIWVSYLTSYHGQLSAITNKFSVKLQNLSDYSILEDLSRQYGCEVYHRDLYDPDEFLVYLPKDSELGTIQLANAFFESGRFEYTSPDFFLFNYLCSSDPDYSYQWGLKNTGQFGPSGIDIGIESAWNITEGSSNIVVAVIDTGVELTHPDLSANLVDGYDAVIEDDGGSPWAQTSFHSHGTKVSGIIGAIKDNNIGISGVAPSCKIMPVNAAGWYALDEDALIRGVYWAKNEGADVINCSWNGLGQPNTSLWAAINSAATQGRGGKGCVIVFCSGNEGSYVTQPAHLDNVMAVGAISYTGYRCSFSNYGSSLDVVAPGYHIRSTVLQGSYDYDDGTSFAASHVSGIAALILSEYPDLSASQVRRAIELGCTSIPNYTFNEDDDYPVGLWNNEVGYGRANAYDALLWAEFAHETNVTDGISGFDFTLTNHSSYDVWALFVGLTGDILNYNETLIFHDPGDVDSGEQVGYPFYRGENLSATPGTPVSNIWLELFAMTPNYYGDLRIGVAIDNPTPTTYTTVSFGDGDTIFLNLPNSTVPNASRRRVYIDVKDPLL